jgi:hypothetical protein
MDEDDFLAQFEAGTLPQDGFHHADHLHAAWLYLTRFPAAEAIARFAQTLKSYAAALGKADRYHETVTWAHMLLVNERIGRSDAAGNWGQFSVANADLFDWKNSILLQYYSQQTLDSELARRVFVMPDRLLDHGKANAT